VRARIKVHLLTHVIATMPASSIIVPATATATMAIVILFATNVVAGLYALKALRSTDPDSSIVVGLVILDTCLLVSFSIVYFIASRQWHHFIPSSIAAGFLTYNLVSLIFASTADRDAATFLWHVLSIPLGISGIVHITSQ
jgi:hypothetical protein